MARGRTTPRRHEFTRALLRVTSSTAWLAADRPTREALLWVDGYEARVITVRLVEVSQRLHDEWAGARARGLPVPGWWRG